MHHNKDQIYICTYKKPIRFEFLISLGQNHPYHVNFRPYSVHPDSIILPLHGYAVKTMFSSQWRNRRPENVFPKFEYT